MNLTHLRGFHPEQLTEQYVESLRLQSSMSQQRKKPSDFLIGWLYPYDCANYARRRLKTSNPARPKPTSIIVDGSGMSLTNR